MVVYIGRIHPTKGLTRLLEAWGEELRLNPGWHLVIAGPDEDGYRSILEKRLHELGCANTVHFPGLLDDEAKWVALENASLFIMPSDFENFGIAIVEALAAGLPVITTSGTPWSNLPKEDAGWWITPNTQAITSALHEALSLSDEARRKMGENGKRIAAQFSPKIVVKDLLQVYAWLLGRGPRPECVRVD